MLVVPPMAAGCSTAVLRAGQQTVFQLIAAAPIPWSKPAATKCSAKATRTAFRERSPVVPLLMGATACLLDGWLRGATACPVAGQAAGQEDQERRHAGRPQLVHPFPPCGSVHAGYDA